MHLTIYKTGFIYHNRDVSNAISWLTVIETYVIGYIMVNSIYILYGM